MKIKLKFNLTYHLKKHDGQEEIWNKLLHGSDNAMTEENQVSTRYLKRFLL